MQRHWKRWKIRPRADAHLEPAHRLAEMYPQPPSRDDHPRQYTHGNSGAGVVTSLSTAREVTTCVFRRKPATDSD